MTSYKGVIAVGPRGYKCEKCTKEKWELFVQQFKSPDIFNYYFCYRCFQKQPLRALGPCHACAKVLNVSTVNLTEWFNDFNGTYYSIWLCGVHYDLWRHIREC